MHPAIETPADATAEGGEYARALLERIGSGAAGPRELATLMQFLYSGDLLHGAALVFHAALHAAVIHARGGHP